MPVEPMPAIDVFAFYKFAPLTNCAELRQRLLDHCLMMGVKGIILLAEEGINATIACRHGEMDAVMSGIENITGLAPLTGKASFAPNMPFRRMKVRLKKEIVTIGDPTVDPLKGVGTYVKPSDWNALISDPEVLLIDTRNSFEFQFGTFKGAADPGTQAFGDFPAYVRKALDPARHSKIAMFCTGGIRCEKATSLLLREGFEEVYHLEGGILKYLEEVPKQDSLWQGACFVFDERVALEHGLEIASLRLCLNCNAPLDAAALQHPAYEEGVCCGACAGSQTPSAKTSARERQRQISARARHTADE